MNPEFIVDEAIACAMYDQQKQYLTMHRNRYVHTLRALSKCSPPKRFLEIGSSGFFMRLAKTIWPTVEVFGTQYSNEAGFKEEDVPFNGWGNYSFYLGNPERFPYSIEPDSFDLILCAEVIEHMSVDPMALLAEINRILVVGGRLVLTTPNIVGSRSILAALEHRMPFNFYAFNKSRTTDRHNIEYSPDLLSNVLRSAGFDIEYLVTVNAWSLPDERVEKIYSMFNFDTQLRGDDIIVTAVKKGTVEERYPDFLYI